MNETKEPKTFQKRIWLNKENSTSTGSMVCYHGPYKYRNGEIIDYTFLELADCYNKIRLHMTDMDTLDDFINKLILLRDNIDAFIEFLKNK